MNTWGRILAAALASKELGAEVMPLPIAVVAD
jgi:hypothetical protein